MKLIRIIIFSFFCFCSGILYAQCPALTISPSAPTICKGSSQTLTASASGTILSYSWAPSAGLNVTTGTVVVATPTITTTYTVTGTTNCGQSVKKTVVVTVTNCAKNYCFIQSNGTYVPITGGSTLVADDDVVYAGTALGFTFNFNGNNYTTCAVSTNGFITFGGTNPANGYVTPISGTTAYGGAISAMGADLTNSGATSPEMRYQTLGTSPNRRFVMQWKNWRRYSATALADILNFQIILYEGTNKIDIVYGSNTSSSISSVDVQVGLRGSANTDFINRSTTTDWSGTTAGSANTSTCRTKNTILPTSGLTFSYSLPSTVGVTPTFVSICIGSSTTLTASGSSAYIWSPSAGLNTTTGATVVATPSITTTYTVSNGCATVATSTVTVKSLPSITANPSLTICSGKSATLTVSGGTAYRWSTGATTTSITVAPTINTGYIVTVTNGCSATVSNTVAVNSVPTASITASPSFTICNGQSTTLIGTPVVGSSYSWSTGATTTSITVSPTANTVYTLTATNASGCSATSTKTVVVNAAPAVGVAASPSFTICTGSNTTLTASGGTNYSWSTGATTASIVVSPTSSTGYTVTASGGAGCPGVATRTVTIKSLPAITGNPSLTLCRGQSTTLTASGGTAYRWNTGATTASITVAPTVNTGYIVTVTNGCSATVTNTVTVNPVPTASITVSPSPTLCRGQSATLTGTSAGGTGYSWNTGATTSSITVSPTTNTGYTLTVANVAGCTALATRTITVNATPTVNVTASPSFTICTGTNTTLTASGASIYAWSPSAGLSATTGSTVVATPTITTVYSITGTTSGCTSSATTVTVTVTKCPRVKDYCFNQSTGSYTSITAGTVITAADDNVTLATIGFTFNFNGVNYTSCAISTNGFITFGGTNPASTLFTPISGTTAYGGAISAIGADLTNSGATSPEMRCQNLGSSPNRRFIVQWKNWRRKSGITALADVLNFQIILHEGTNKVDIIYGSTTTASTSVTVQVGLRGASNGDFNNRSTTTNWSSTTAGSTNASSCTTTSTIRPSAGLTFSYMPAPTINIVPESVSLCIGNSSTLTASGASSYIWSPSAGLNITTGSIVVAGPTASTTYTVTGTANGCSAKNSVAVTVNAKPIVLVTASAYTVCSGGESTLTASGASTYTWSPVSGLNITTGSVVLANPTVSTTYTVTGTNSSGCSSSSTIILVVGSMSSANAGADQTICAGGSVVLHATGGSSCIWSPPDGLDRTDIFSPTATPAVTTLYKVTISGPDVCPLKNTDEVLITVKDNPEVITSGDVVLCDDSGVEISASGGTSYLWSPAAGLSNTTIANPIANPSITTTYAVNVKNADGCSGNGIVKVYKGITTDVSVSPTQITCAGNPIQIFAEGGITYLWSPVKGLSCTTCSSPSADPSTTTTYKVKVVTKNGCNVTKEVTVIVEEALSVMVGPDQTACVGQEVTLNATGGTNYSWNPSTGLSCDDCPDPTLFVSETREYTVTVTEGNCAARGSVLISVNPEFTATFTTRVLGCTAHFYESPAGLLSYKWDFGDGQSSAEINPEHAYLSSGKYNVCLTVTGSCGTHTVCNPVEVTDCNNECR